MNRLTLTLAEKRNLEYKELQERRTKEKEDLRNELQTTLADASIEVLSIEGDEDGYKVKMAFTLDEYRQENNFYWMNSESKDDFLKKTKREIDYIKELREKYPDYCKQNDYIQSNREFKKTFSLTHMGYKRTYDLNLKLADFLKLPNTTDTGFGGGDYEIKRTPERVEEYNENIDKTIDVLLDCIAELKQKKYVE